MKIRPQVRRSPRGVTFVQVVVVVTLLAMGVAGMTYALYGELSELFGKADETMAGGGDDTAASMKTQNSNDTGTSAEADPNAMKRSIQQGAKLNTDATAKAKGTP
jgi:hypothetical protein